MLIPKIVAFTGLAGVGKNTCADVLTEKYGYKQIAFADPLKNKVANWVCRPYELPPDLPLYLAELVSECHDQWMKSDIDGSVDWVRAKPYSPELRKLLQHAGTEYYRSRDARYWIKSIHLDPDQHYVITDMRFPDEAAFAKAIGAALIRISRIGYDTGDLHESERHVPTLDVHYDFFNEFGEVDLLPGKLYKAMSYIVGAHGSSEVVTMEVE
jgi:hypothetical protein